MSYQDEPRLQLVADIMNTKQKASRAFVQYMTDSHEYGPETELHMREAHFITALTPGKGTAMSDVAQNLAVTHGAVSQTASRLEKKGYIVRKRDPENHRVVQAFLTPKGEEFYQSHIQYDSEKFAQMNKAFFSKCSDSELELIRDYENVMYAMFTKENGAL